MPFKPEEHQSFLLLGTAEPPSYTGFSCVPVTMWILVVFNIRACFGVNTCKGWSSCVSFGNPQCVFAEIDPLTVSEYSVAQGFTTAMLFADLCLYAARAAVTMFSYFGSVSFRFEETNWRKRLDTTAAEGIHGIIRPADISTTLDLLIQSCGRVK